MPSFSPTRLRLLIGLCLGLSGLAVPGWAQVAVRPVVVRVKQGSLQGTQEANLCVFRGIPYAQPPVGALRFRPPQPPLRYQGRGPRPAVSYGSKALQTGGPAGVQGSEDCLYLNVWAPAWPATARRPTPRPVVVWVHGGAFTGGSGQDNDVWTFAAQDSIVAVSFNYRLGSLGFLHLGNSLGPAYRQAGNNGLLDAVAALRWVHDNIRAFGGDPQRVTIMGESAGAKLVGALLVAPAAEGLFQQAILESGAVQAIRDTATAATVRQQLLTELQRPAARALLSVAADSLLQAQAHFASGVEGLQVFGPVLDYRAVPVPPMDYLRHSRRPRAVLLGTNREEAGLFTGAGSALAQPNEPALERVFGRNSAAVWQAYQQASRTQPALQAWNNTLTDYLYRLATYRLADTLATQGWPVWLYRFDWHSATQRPVHAQELTFVWNAPAGSSGTAPALANSNPGKAADPPLAARMHAHWASFIKTGRPGPEWPAYTIPTKPVMVFDSVTRPEAVTNPYQDPAFPTQAYRR